MKTLRVLGTLPPRMRTQSKVNDRYIMDPSPIPKFDNPKMDNMPALQLFGAGREKRIYAIPLFTKVEESRL